MDRENHQGSCLLILEVLESITDIVGIFVKNYNNMFVQIFRSKDMFIMVNVNHIVSLEPVNNGAGCTVMLSTGTSFYSVENYNAILENINNTK